MGFGGVFGGFEPVFGAGGAAAGPWWLSGGISAATCMAAYLAKGAASLAASYSNLNNPGTNDASAYGALTWNAVDGWICTNVVCAQTPITPASGYAMLVRFTALTGEYVGGEVTSGGSLYLRPNRSAAWEEYASGAAKFQSGAWTAGVAGVANQKGYKNGAPVMTAIGAWTAPAGYTLFICGANGAAVNPETCKIQAAVIYSAPPTDAQMLAVSTAMAAL